MVTGTRRRKLEDSINIWMHDRFSNQCGQEYSLKIGHALQFKHMIFFFKITVAGHSLFSKFAIFVMEKIRILFILMYLTDNKVETISQRYFINVHYGVKQSTVAGFAKAFKPQ